MPTILATPFSEGAWARGSFSGTLSASLVNLNIDTSKDNSEENYVLSKEGSFTWQKFEFTKGIIWPLDLNVSFSFNEENKMLKWNGLLQYSIFQKPFFPSVSLRSGYSHLNWINHFEASNFDISIATSWGYSYLTIFASRIENFSSIVSQNYQNSQNQYGIQMKLNPLSRLSFSRVLEEEKPVSNEIKFSVGL